MLGMVTMLSEFVYDKLAEFNKKIIVLAGDTHNAWASYLYSQKGKYVGVELATSSVSSQVWKNI